MSDIFGLIDIENNLYDVENINNKLNENSIKLDLLNPLDGVYIGYSNFNQMLFSENKDLLICFCGKIYNDKFLKEELISKGYTFNTNESSEVILHLFEEYDEDFVKKLDGMFSLCIFNKNKKSLFIARDRFGIKPMYYSYSNNCFFFSTEIKNILSVKSKNSLNYDAIELYTHLRFIPAPYSIIESINKLKAGEYLIFKDGNIRKSNFIKYNEIFENQTELGIEKAFQSDVLDTFNNENEAGVFLSGGLDSSIITSILKHSGKDFKTFSVGYEVQTDNDETSIAKTVASELNVSNIQFKIYNNELLNLIDEVSYCLEEPLYSTVSVATLKLSKMSLKNLKSILTGDGSDELFFGYKYLLESLNQIDKEKYYIDSIGWVKETDYKKLLLINRFNYDDIKKILFEDCYMNDIAETFRRIEIFKRLPDYHFARMERLANSCGLEVRVPYMRNKTAKNALMTNYKILIDESNPKKYLKTQLKSFMTPTIEKNRKRPFTSPTKLWIENILMEDIKRIFKDNELVTLCGLNFDTINNILINYSGSYSNVSEIWGVYMLLKWVEQHKKFLI